MPRKYHPRRSHIIDPLVRTARETNLLSYTRSLLEHVIRMLTTEVGPAAPALADVRTSTSSSTSGPGAAPASAILPYLRNMINVDALRQMLNTIANILGRPIALAERYRDVYRSVVKDAEMLYYLVFAIIAFKSMPDDPARANLNVIINTDRTRHPIEEIFNTFILKHDWDKVAALVAKAVNNLTIRLANILGLHSYTHRDPRPYPIRYVYRRPIGVYGLRLLARHYTIGHQYMNVLTTFISNDGGSEAEWKLNINPSPQGDRAVIHFIRINPIYRNRGLARLVIADLIRFLRRRDVLGLATLNIMNMPFGYEGIGTVAAHDREADWADDRSTPGYGIGRGTPRATVGDFPGNVDDDWDLLQYYMENPDITAALRRTLDLEHTMNALELPPVDVTDYRYNDRFQYMLATHHVSTTTLNNDLRLSGLLNVGIKIERVSRYPPQFRLTAFPGAFLTYHIVLDALLADNPYHLFVLPHEDSLIAEATGEAPTIATLPGPETSLVDAFITTRSTPPRLLSNIITVPYHHYAQMSAFLPPALLPLPPVQSQLAEPRRYRTRIVPTPSGLSRRPNYIRSTWLLDTQDRPYVQNILPYTVQPTAAGPGPVAGLTAAATPAPAQEPAVVTITPGPHIAPILVGATPIILTLAQAATNFLFGGNTNAGPDTSSGKPV